MIEGAADFLLHERVVVREHLLHGLAATNNNSDSAEHVVAKTARLGCALLQNK